MYSNSVFLKSLDSVHKEWETFLNSETLSILIEIEKKIINPGIDYTPNPKNVLRFLNVSLSETKIIILGQDPYPQKGVATGRAFEVGTLNSWDQKFNNISLKNIVRSIYYAYTGSYKKYSEILPEMNQRLHIKPPNELFGEWEKQGVLLLNTSFTCEIGKSNSHEKLWNPFTQLLLNYITKMNPEITWFLWGSNAKLIVSGIEINHKIESMHPMMCYDRPNRKDDFLFGEINAFKETMHIVNWLG